MFSNVVRGIPKVRKAVLSLAGREVVPIVLGHGEGGGVQITNLFVMEPRRLVEHRVLFIVAILSGGTETRIEVAETIKEPRRHTQGSIGAVKKRERNKFTIVEKTVASATL